MAKKETATTTKTPKTTKKSTRKAAPKTSVKTRTSVQSLAVDEPVMTKSPATKNQKPQAAKMKKSYVLLILAIIAIGALLYVSRSLFVAAVVNGQPISRLAVIKDAEKQSGKQSLTTLVRNILIEQEATKRNVTISDQEINDEIKKVEGNLSKQGQKLDEVLTMQGMTRDDLRRLIRLDKLVGKIVGKDIQVSDKDITDYIEKNKDTLPQGQTDEQIRQSVKDRLKQQMLSEKVQAWLADIQKKAKIIYFVQY